MKKLMRTVIFAVIGIFLCNTLHSQQTYTQADAATLYNQSIQIMKTDLSAAIDLVDSCLKICAIVGDSAIEIQTRAEQFLCDLQLRYSSQLYYTDKKINEALISTKKAIQISEKYKNESIKEKSEKLLAQIYTSLGNNYFKEKAFEKAIVAFDSALILNPELYKMALNKALVYKAMNKPTEFGNTIDEYIELAAKKNDTAQVSFAKKQAIDYFRALGSKANSANKLNDAIELLNKALVYGEDKDVYYYLSDVYNKQKKYNEAINAAEKGLALETGNAEAKAKFYYSLGVAQLGKGLKDEACESFKNAMYGQFVQAAKAQRINNKCDQK